MRARGAQIAKNEHGFIAFVCNPLWQKVPRPKAGLLGHTAARTCTRALLRLMLRCSSPRQVFVMYPSLAKQRTAIEANMETWRRISTGARGSVRHWEAQTHARTRDSRTRTLTHPRTHATEHAPACTHTHTHTHARTLTRTLARTREHSGRHTHAGLAGL